MYQGNNKNPYDDERNSDLPPPTAKDAVQTFAFDGHVHGMDIYRDHPGGAVDRTCKGILRKRGAGRKTKVRDVWEFVLLSALFKQNQTDYMATKYPLQKKTPIRDQVTPEWVQAEMNAHNIKLRDLEEFTEIPRQQLSNWITGIRKMSQAVKVMFHLIFLNR